MKNVGDFAEERYQWPVPKDIPDSRPKKIWRSQLPEVAIEMLITSSCTCAPWDWNIYPYMNGVKLR